VTRTTALSCPSPPPAANATCQAQPNRATYEATDTLGEAVRNRL
jgi:hypothetical protein